MEAFGSERQHLAAVSWAEGFDGDGAGGVELGGGEEDAEVVLGVDAQQAGLDLAVLALGEHVEKEGEKVGRMGGVLA